MRIPDEFFSEVLERTDIVSLIGKYTTLKRAGGNMVGLCPFHSERTPSFTVYPNNNSFYCFGCHKGGSALTFVEEAENLTLVDAVAFLADRAGLDMPAESMAPTQNDHTVTRKRVLEMNLLSAKYFRNCLWNTPEGEAGRDYLLNTRKLPKEVLDHFGAGFAPDNFTALVDFLRQNGFRDFEIEGAYLGKTSEKTGKLYDIFRNRVMFPIIDTTGAIVAFGGRVMDDSKPKYLNSGDTPAFKKSNHLFALNYAKNHCAEDMILCEGYMDVIALHSRGFENAVATLGTAITPNHARIFAKYTKKVIISYDGDEAGQTAANKAMALLSEVGVETRILRMAGAKDPDEFIRKNGGDAFRRLLDDSVTGFEFKKDKIVAKYNLSIPNDRIRCANELCAVIAEYRTTVERAVYVVRVSKILELSPDTLNETIKILLRKRARDQREENQRTAVSTLRNFGDKINPEGATHPALTAAEETVLGLMLLFPEHRVAVRDGKVKLTEEDFPDALYKRLFHTLLDADYREELLDRDYTPEEMGRIRTLTVRREQLSENGDTALLSGVETLKKQNEKTEEKNLSFEELIAKKRQRMKGNG